MICPKCGKEVSDGSKFCPECGQFIRVGQQEIQKESIQQNTVSQSSEPKKTAWWKWLIVIACLLIWPVSIVGIILLWVWKMPKSKGGRIALTIIFALYFLISLVSWSGNKSSDNTTYILKDETSGTTEMTDSAADPAAENETAAAEDTSAITENETPAEQSGADYTNMVIGDIGVKDNVWVSLDYVKKMSYLPTALGTSEEVAAGNDVILAFFEFGNGNTTLKSVSPNSIECYADGTQAGEIDNTYNVVCDGVNQFYSADLDNGELLLTVEDYLVPSGWQELKFFYGSECIWTVSASEVSEAEFTGGGLLSSNNSFIVTPEDTVMSAENYELTYKGSQIYYYDNVIEGQVPYIVFKFNMKNTSAAEVDASLMGYEMRAYQNNYLLDDATFTMDDTIDGFTNIYDVDSVQAGMTADIYVAFEVKDEPSSYLMVFDDGYIANNIVGTVYAEYK